MPIVFVFSLPVRWNFSVGNFELKFVPEIQSNRNFLEGEASNGETWREVRREAQRVIQEETDAQTKNHANTHSNSHTQVEGLDLVIKVSVPDWKVMAFSTKPEGQLIWEHQVSRLNLFCCCLESQLKLHFTFFMVSSFLSFL